MTQHTFHPQTLDPRSAGKVTRFHTWERIKDQSVGEHSWQVLRILLAIWPEVPRELMVYAMFHDVGERVTGDIPYPVKAERPRLKEIMEALESDATIAMSPPWGIPLSWLTPEHRPVFKLAEFIEMWEYALDEIALGNRNCVLIADRCLAQAILLLSSACIPPAIHNSTNSYINTRIQHERDYRNCKHAAVQG